MRASTLKWARQYPGTLSKGDYLFGRDARSNTAWFQTFRELHNAVNTWLPLQGLAAPLDVRGELGSHADSPKKGASANFVLRVLVGAADEAAAQTQTYNRERKLKETSDMRVEDLMTRQVQWCRPEGSLEQAARLMWDHDCGCIPVCSGDGADRVVGVITDRDICMSALFQGKSLSGLRVSDAMSKSVETCRSADTLAQAEKTMRSSRIRRLPVLNKDGVLVGMISLADLAREAARERTRAQKEITETEVGDILATICQSSLQSLPSSGRSATA